MEYYISTILYRCQMHTRIISNDSVRWHVKPLFSNWPFLIIMYIQYSILINLNHFLVIFFQSWILNTNLLNITVFWLNALIYFISVKNPPSDKDQLILASCNCCSARWRNCNDSNTRNNQLSMQPNFDSFKILILTNCQNINIVWQSDHGENVINDL